MIQTIQSKLYDHPWRDNIVYFEQIDSTNTYAKTLAHQGAPHGTVVLADSQTAGRGRLGRTFNSPKAMGIYLSVILRPNCKPQELMHLTCVCGVAACRAVEKTNGIQPGIKWTNDLVLGKRKLGGILTELAVDPATGLVDWVIVGIGINCCQKESDFPPELQSMACSLGIPSEKRGDLAASLILQLYQMQQDLFTKKDAYMDAFRKLCITINQRICLLQGDHVRYGTARYVHDDGSLEVIFDDGTNQAVASGEVSIRGMYGYV